MKNTIIVVFLCITSIGMAQTDFNKEIKNKGKFFLYWGWNRGYFSDSDISFKGDDYDFTLYDVKASDRQTPFSVDSYLNPGNITIPQTNYRIGYFFKENYTISVGVDHMKYVVDIDQTAKINGEITGSYPNGSGGDFQGVYTGNDMQLLDENFLKLEHTDGLNYVNVEVSRFDNISSFFKLNAKNFQINATEGVGIGILYPRTNATLLGKEKHDDFHISGYGVSARVGLDFTLFKYFFIMPELKTGYINMGDIRTTKSTSDSASQSFGYFQTTIVFGGRFNL
jgi:hypothetical protein